MDAAFHKNQILTLEIDGIASDGNGVGRADGMAVFVPGAVQGDRLEVRLVKLCRNHAFGSIQRILSPAPARVAPDCPVHRACGGCDFRAMTYAAELAAKRGFVQDAITRLGGFSLTVQPVLPSPEQDGYRNKVQYPLTRLADGHAAAGFYASRSHRVVPCADCRLQPAALNAIARTVCELLDKWNISIYNEATGQGLVRHLYLRRGAHSGQVMVCLVCTAPTLPRRDDFLRALLARHPEVVTVVLNVNGKKTNVVLGAQTLTLYGSGTIRDSICGVPVTLDPHAFYQVNTPAAEILYREAARFALLPPEILAAGIGPDAPVAAPQSGTAHAQSMTPLSQNECGASLSQSGAALSQGELSPAQAAPALPHCDGLLLDLYCGAGTIGLSMASHFARLIGVEVVPQAVENARANAAALGLAADRAQFLCADAGQAAARLAAEGLRPQVIVLDPPRKGCDAPTLQAVLRMAPQRIVMVSCDPATAARDLRVLADGGYTLHRVQPADLFPRTRHVESVSLLLRASSEPTLDDAKTDAAKDDCKVEIRFGEMDAALQVMQEVAAWGRQRGYRVWPAEWLTAEALLAPYAQPENFCVGLVDGEVACAFLLQWEDPENWPGTPRGQAAYLHKFCVRRKYAGRGMTKLVTQALQQECRKRGLRYIRLDTALDEKTVRKIYLDAGYKIVDILDGPGGRSLALYEQQVD